MRNALISVVAAVAAIVLVAVVSGSHPGPTAHTKVSIKTLQMFRSITVSPSSVACGHYSGGSPGYVSTPTALGFPGRCRVGNLTGTSNLPVTITYYGPPGFVTVEASNAVPDGGGPTWDLCGPGSSGCKGPNGSPGENQFSLRTFSRANSQHLQLTGHFRCDTQFNPAGSTFTVTRRMSQHEGALFVGPSTTQTTSTTYTVTITWMATGRDGCTS